MFRTLFSTLILVEIEFRLARRGNKIKISNNNAMYVLALFILLLFIIVVMYSLFVALNATDEPTSVELQRFENEGVQLIDPPAEIVVEGNPHECHKSLTPCVTHADCDVCREGLANCQYFDEMTVMETRDADGDVVQHTIEPGESYCMALDRDRARSCNPHTGIWLLAEAAAGFSLLCHCLTPGLVTQLNMYEDCAVAVGCQPHGRIADLNESPLRCVCDDGYVADFDATTQTPYCRPRKVRDVVYDESFFHRAPCDEGFVSIDHPALDETYRQELRLPDICVVDPCSVDPISGQRTGGRLRYYKNDAIEYKYCHCPISKQLFGVYSPFPSMIGESSSPVHNACLQPFNVSILNVHRIDYKFYWARADLDKSDDDVVAMVESRQLSHDRYRKMAYSYLEQHPNLIAVGFVLFKFSTAYDFFIRADNFVFDDLTLFEIYKYMPLSQSICFRPGPEGRCITVNPNSCIRRHNSAAVGFAETFTNSWCYLSIEDNNIRNLEQNR
ncbi:pif-1 [Euproctis pseudoconspersa nucleopolyhedrovirus]|uniref:Pif-1 n=1 Tax=Euproctis pseudoconspersa nucleopolyhedrovirus TaxID=307467 RepID=C3TX23_9ABAC|nr:pif-1 [Euproctis pseudoconspersa nucleopolyhedrovirus]ACO53565.1 pif-1 [Euproctis pseudoconspersa nucleopolyhedrovirus]